MQNSLRIKSIERYFFSKFYAILAIMVCIFVITVFVIKYSPLYSPNGSTIRSTVWKLSFSLTHQHINHNYNNFPDTMYSYVKSYFLGQLVFTISSSNSLYIKDNRYEPKKLIIALFA